MLSRRAREKFPRFPLGVLSQKGRVIIPLVSGNITKGAVKTAPSLGATPACFFSILWAARVLYCCAEVFLFSIYNNHLTLSLCVSRLARPRNSSFRTLDWLKVATHLVGLPFESVNKPAPPKLRRTNNIRNFPLYCVYTRQHSAARIPM